jgi:hypothetical protein
MMNEEKQGAEREAEALAIAAQQKADFEHLVKNVHPSLLGSATLGDSSNGTTQSLSDYAALTLKEQFLQLQLEFQSLRNEFDLLSSRVLQDWTPETPTEELPPAPAPVIQMPAPAPDAPAPAAPPATTT